MDTMSLFLIFFLIIIIISLIYLYIVYKDYRTKTKKYASIIFPSSSSDSSIDQLSNMYDISRDLRYNKPSIEDYESIQFNIYIYKHLLFLLILFYTNVYDDLSLIYTETYIYNISKVIYFNNIPLIRLYLNKTSNNENQLSLLSLYVVIRGTKTSKECFYGIQIIQDSDIYDINARYHSGFYSIYKDIRNELLNYIQEMSNNYKLKIYIIGHSLGAVLSTFLSYNLLEYTHNIIVYSLAAPYCINKYISDSLEKIVFFRIENEFDEICRFLSNNIKYKDHRDIYWKAGTLISFKDNIDVLKNHELITYYKNINNYYINNRLFDEY